MEFISNKKNVRRLRLKQLNSRGGINSIGLNL